MKRLCQHLTPIKVQKVSNLLAKATLTCSGNKKHSHSDRIDICLTCGQNRCERYDQTLCSYQHSYGTKHALVYRTPTKHIHCLICQQDLTQFLSSKAASQAEKDLKKIDKMLDIHNKILQLTQKINSKKEICIVEQSKDKQRKPKGKGKGKQKGVVGQKYKSQSDEQTQSQVSGQNEKLVVQGSNNKKLSIFGLKNLGNTCFFNSTIQCLYATEILHHLYPTVQMDTQRQFGKIGQIMLLFNKFLKNTDQFYSPKALFSWIGKSKGVYKHMDQQDAQEVLGVLLNGLIDSEKFWRKPIQNEEKSKKIVSLTEKIFGFTLASRLQCLGCQKISWSLDFSLQIAVQLSKPKEKKVALPQGQILKEQIGQEGLFYPQQKLTHTIIDNFFAPEFFNKQNYFECQNCQSQKAFRKFYIKDPPLILIITLKRFNNNLSKNNGHINIVKNLQLQGHCINKGQHHYELYAMIVHSGTARGGHYVAYTCRMKDWYFFSDGSFKPQSWDKVKSSQPYILFYKRITP